MNGIILFGQMGSGKDTVADILREYGYTTVKLGKYIRENVNKFEYQDCDKRPLYQQYGQMCRYLFGDDVWNNTLYEDMKKMHLQHITNEFVIADGRQENELRYWKTKGFTTIGIIADAEIRDARLIKRDGVSQKQYFNHQTEIEAVRCIDRCDYKIINEGTIEELQRVVKIVLREIRNKGANK